MIRHTCIGLVLALLASQPAIAVTYTGALYGIITKGGAYDGGNQDPNYQGDDLSGLPIYITFTTEISYYKGIYDSIAFDHVIDTISIIIPTIPALQNVTFVTSNDYAYEYDSTGSFAGNAKSASLSQSQNYGSDYVPSLFLGFRSFSYAGASQKLGPLSGGGYTSTVEQGTVSNYSATFSLFYGSVTGTPEPDAWALMILGFAAVGSTLRHQRRKARYAASWQGPPRQSAS